MAQHTDLVTGTLPSSSGSSSKKQRAVISLRFFEDVYTITMNCDVAIIKGLLCTWQCKGGTAIAYIYTHIVGYNVMRIKSR